MSGYAARSAARWPRPGPGWENQHDVDRIRPGRGRRGQTRTALLKTLLGRLEIRMLGLALLIAIVLSILSPYFLTTKNLLNVLDQSVVIGIVSIGMTFVILTGGIDLSVGSVAGVAGVVFGLTAPHAG